MYEEAQTMDESEMMTFFEQQTVDPKEEEERTVEPPPPSNQPQCCLCGNQEVSYSGSGSCSACKKKGKGGVSEKVGAPKSCWTCKGKEKCKKMATRCSLRCNDEFDDVQTQQPAHGGVEPTPKSTATTPEVGETDDGPPPGCPPTIAPTPAPTVAPTPEVAVDEWDDDWSKFTLYTDEEKGYGRVMAWDGCDLYDVEKAAEQVGVKESGVPDDDEEVVDWEDDGPEQPFFSFGKRLPWEVDAAA